MSHNFWCKLRVPNLFNFSLYSSLWQTFSRPRDDVSLEVAQDAEGEYQVWVFSLPLSAQRVFKDHRRLLQNLLTINFDFCHFLAGLIRIYVTLGLLFPIIYKSIIHFFDPLLILSRLGT